jgi:membrane-associated phospholipid phosphatase
MELIGHLVLYVNNFINKKNKGNQWFPFEPSFTIDNSINYQLGFISKISNHYISRMQEIIEKIGFMGPLILLFIGIYNLCNQQKYLLSYLVFFVGNTIINKILKKIIKQKRPSNSKKILNEEYSGEELYGMPSGHAQSCFFSISFLYFVKGSPTWLIIELFIAALTIYQRWKYRQHTLEQLFAGSLVGIAFAYFSFYLTKQWLSEGK